MPYSIHLIQKLNVIKSCAVYLTEHTHVVLSAGVIARDGERKLVKQGFLKKGLSNQNPTDPCFHS